MRGISNLLLFIMIIDGIIKAIHRYGQPDIDGTAVD